jgi:hypothetical protein
MAKLTQAAEEILQFWAILKLTRALVFWVLPGFGLLFSALWFWFG